MKILLIAPSILPVPATKGGAIENTLESIIEYNEKNKNHEYTIISVLDKAALKKSEKFNYTNVLYIKLTLFDKIIQKTINLLTFNKLNFDIYGWKAKRKVKEMKFDLAIIHNRPNYYKYFKNNTNQLALHLHNDKLNKDTKNAIYISQQYDYFFSVSNFIKNKIAEVAPKEKIEVLYNGVDLNVFHGEKNIEMRKKYRKNLSIPEDSVIFLYTGRLVAAKGVLELIKAFNIASKNRNIYLIIAGGSKTEAGSDIEYQRKLKAEATEKIIFTGYIKHSQLSKYENIADVGIVPSLFEEPFGKVVIEHLASNNPVIVSDAGGIPEIVTDKQQGVIVPRKKDFIKQLALEIQKYSENKVLLNVRETILNFDINEFNRKRLDIINNRSKF